MAVLRISGKTNLFITTRAIVSMIHKHKHAEIQALGRSAVQHAEKAVGRATAFLEEEDITIVSKTWNMMRGVDGNEREGIRFMIRGIE
jgi:stage V sporulation protein SpoVS